MITIRLRQATAALALLVHFHHHRLPHGGPLLGNRIVRDHAHVHELLLHLGGHALQLGGRAAAAALQDARALRLVEDVRIGGGEQRHDGQQGRAPGRHGRIVGAGTALVGGDAAARWTEREMVAIVVRKLCFMGFN